MSRFISGGNANNAATLEASLAIPYKTKQTLKPYAPASVFPCIFPKYLKTYVHIKTRTWMFIVGLFKLPILG